MDNSIKGGMKAPLAAYRLSSELVREEVKTQVQQAMADKDVQLRELRQQNETSLVSSGEGVGQGHRALVRGSYGVSGTEPGINPAT